MKSYLILSLIPLLLIVPGIAFGEDFHNVHMYCEGDVLTITVFKNSATTIPYVKITTYDNIDRRIQEYRTDENGILGIKLTSNENKMVLTKYGYNEQKIIPINCEFSKNKNFTEDENNDISTKNFDSKNFEMVEKLIMYSKLGKLQIITPEHITISNNSFEIKGQLKSSMKEYPPVKIQLLKIIEVPNQGVVIDGYVRYSIQPIGCVYSDEFPIQKDGTFYISDNDVNLSEIECEKLYDLAWEIFSKKEITHPNKSTPIMGGSSTSDIFYLNLHNIENSYEWAEYVIHSKFPPTNVLFMNSESFPLKISKVPDWVKNNAKWWSDSQVDDTTFSQGIGYLIKENIIEIDNLPSSSADSDQSVPEWVKNNAKWWADGMISEDDFLKGITYMVEKGIIRAQ